jgi:phosphoglycerate dehydrogenase-like enzyme
MTTILVVARPDDEALRALMPPPADARLVVGWSPADFGAAAAEAEVIVACSAPADVVVPVLRGAPQVRWIHSIAAGVDNLLAPEIVDAPIVLTNARGAYSVSLAEWAMGAVLHFAKDVRRLIRSQEARRWDPFDVRLIQGRTLGIVGYGDIGRRTAERARAFGMKIVAVRREPGVDPSCDEVFGRDRLGDALARSDYVVAAAPLTPETRGLIGAAAFQAMKPDAVLINVGRGPVVDEAALVAALQTGRLRGAALDVFEREPLSPESPLYSMENVLLSPHSADHFAGWRESSMRLFLENLALFRASAPLRNVVDKRKGY